MKQFVGIVGQSQKVILHPYCALRYSCFVSENGFNLGIEVKIKSVQLFVSIYDDFVMIKCSLFT